MLPKELESLTLQERLHELERRFPIQLFTGRSAAVTTVRRMKAEKEWGIPVFMRNGCAVSVEFGTNANQLQEEQWERFYGQMVDQLKRIYPEHYEQIFGRDDEPASH